MADKTPAPKTAVAVVAPKSTAVAMPGSWRDRMKTVAVKVAEAEKPSGGFISFKSGRLSIGDAIMPGDKMDVVVVDYLFHNKWFDTPYNSQKPTPPMCYAFARDEENLQAHESAEDPQSNFCSDCPNNEWGSAGGGSRGKACTNSRRLWLLPADVAQSVDKAARSEYIQCDLPATSVKNFQKFVNDAASAGLAPFQFVVEVSVKPHDRTLFQVYFKAMEQIKDEAILETLANRNWVSESAPYPVYPTKEEMAERASGGAGGSNKY
jgi:hypothetical protein